MLLLLLLLLLRAPDRAGVRLASFSAPRCRRHSTPAGVQERRVRT